MKYYFLNIFFLLFLVSCTDQFADQPPVIRTNQGNKLFWNSNQDVLNINLRPMLNETDKTIILDVERTEFIEDIWLEIQTKIENVENEKNYDELNLISMNPTGANIYLNPLYFDEVWRYNLQEVQLVYYSDNGEQEIILGQHMIMPSYWNAEKSMDLINEDVLDIFLENPGDISYKFIFNEIPEGEIQIVGYQINFVYQYQTVYY